MNWNDTGRLDPMFITEVVLIVYIRATRRMGRALAM